MAEEKISQKKNFLKGIFAENPLLVSLLGTCPALATTKSVEAAIGMGILFTIVLLCSNVKFRISYFLLLHYVEIYLGG